MYRVVIADDEVLIRMYIREILENNGYELKLPTPKQGFAP